MRTNGNESPPGPGQQPAVRERSSRARSGYPLASLALLITVLASLLACVDAEQLRAQSAWLAENWRWRGLALVGSAGIFGGLLGSIYLFASGFSWRKCLIAPVTGILAGELGLLILVAPGPIWRTVFAIGVLLVSAILFRLGAE